MWLVTDHDLNGRPAAFSLSHATEVMRDIVTDLHGQYATPTTDAFLHNAVLLLWHTGEKGLLLDNFLLDKAKVVDWLTFQRAFFNMRRAYSLLCGEDLGTALGDFLFRLQEIFVAYPQIEMKTLLFLAESRLGRLRKLATTGDIATSLEVSTVDLQTALQMKLFHRPLGLSKKLGGAPVGTKRSHEDTDEGTAGGEDLPLKKAQMKKPPQLSGSQPCWNWILKRGGCQGTECKSKTKAGKLTPRPHAFDDGDKGQAEHAYRAWVKKHNLGKD